MKLTGSLVLFAVTAAITASPSFIQSPDAQTHRQRIADLYSKQDAVQSFTQTDLTPDALHLAWSVNGKVFVASLAAPEKSERISADASRQSCTEHDPVWAADSRHLAFLSDCATPGQEQLFDADLTEASSKPRQLTTLNGFLSRPRWSPDGRSIAFLFVDHASRRPSPMAAENNLVGVIDDVQNTDVQTLAVTDLAGGGTRKISPPDLYVFEYDWSPDARRFAYTAAPPPGDDNWYIAQLYTSAAKPAALPQLIYHPKWQIALPRWSPDGRSVAFIEGLMSDEGGTGGEIYTLPMAGGAPRNLTPGRKSSPSWFTWLSDTTILFSEFTAGETAIAQLDIPHASVKQLWRGAETIRATPDTTSLSVAKSNSVLSTALIRTSWSLLPEVWAGPIGQWKPVTSANQSVDLPLPKFESITWKNEGFDVQGWLLFPSNYDPARRYPMLVAVHGGPAWIATPVWRAPDFDTTLFTQFGYFVFFPNIRGSYGEGERFTQANRRDWGFGDMRDLLAGVDAVTGRYPIDRNRVGILGWSYGGSTAMMAITQTRKFRAAVAGAGAGNWQSYYGQNSIDKWMIPYFGKSVYEDPAAYARSSAITYIRNASTPTLVLVGERDGEAPPAQSIEFWHALKELRVPTRLVIYSGEGHSFSKQTDRIDVTARTLDWFDHYMPRVTSH